MYTVRAHKMPRILYTRGIMNVQFEEDNFGRPLVRGFQNQPTSQGEATGQPSGSGMGGWLVRSGLAKDESSANVIMTILALAAIAVSAYVFMFGFSSPQLGPQAPQELPPGLEE